MRLVEARGRLYEAGPAGKMVAVFPMQTEPLEAIVAECADHGIIEIAGYNSPLQHIVGGQHEAVERLMAIVEGETGIPPVIIEPRLPIHTSLFQTRLHRVRGRARRGAVAIAIPALSAQRLRRMRDHG